MAALASLAHDLVSLFYPRVCLACGNVLYKNEMILCFHCLYHLPKTNFHLSADNPCAQQFWGKINFQAAAACYYFTKAGKVQHLIHHLKYKGYKEIGAYIGQLYGPELKRSPYFKSVSAVLPVPLHPRKQAKRGYNQAEWFALGLSEGMKIELDTTTLIRSKASETQTRKSRFMRYENVKEIFTITTTESLANRHVLLVDDVITTGSTLEAAGNALMEIPGISVSVASIACATH
ncbi:MAG: ComF family protein [Lentimicrobium sp.]|jgi:ComF family protein|nr:ComF family protein [Lentimicrobium sp.]MDD2528638.1 phosphoribosyltransferase family protein [Lentimicrobiaceae bacterium]MDD4597753.1 phosphoribosyltransferase family protein [Lentimicrobiaceae bacterium]MDY0025847.1 phosphoribosyltransferase family protein [Lentimicrobium sp.]HAH59651.1 ComF family protein [Bacteroidales bacterium]